MPEDQAAPTPLTLGYSSCPNDTFMFHAMVSGRTPVAGMRWDVIMEDIEQLNQRAFRNAVDVTKISFHAYGQLRHRYVLLSSGAALGRGCGPLLVAGQEETRARLSDPGNSSTRIAIPGWNTSATLLLRLYAPHLKREQLVEMQFDRILASTASGEVDAGLIIHESRFTYQKHGLTSIVDLGEWWESEFDLEIPLGGIVARRDLPVELIRGIDEALGHSVKYARSHPEDSRSYVCQHAQEMSTEVQQAHIDLYVNDFSVALGEQGERAVRGFFNAAEERGILPRYDGPLLAHELSDLG